MTNVYWNGTQQASLTRAQITASWAAPGVAHSGGSILFVNRAFEIYFLALRNIGNCPDPDHSTAMLEALQEAARTGWSVRGNHPDDLEEAFQHIVDNGGTWTDDETRSYMGGRNCAFARALVTGPVSLVEFMNVLDDRLETLRDALTNWDTQSRALLAAERANNWGQVGTVLGGFKTWGERAQPFLWLAPAYQQHLGRAVSWASTLGNIHSGMTAYVQSRRAGFPQGPAAAIGVLRTAIGWVPVLGDFYGRAIDMIPGLTTWFRGVVTDRRRRLDAAAAGRPY